MDIFSEREDELNLRKLILRFCFGGGVGMLMVMVMAKWSERKRSEPDRW